MKEELLKKAKQDENSEILDEIRKNDRYLRDLNERILTLVEEINEQTDFENVTNSIGYLASVKNFKFKRLVTAGDQLKIICELQSSLRSLIRVNTIIQDENGKEVASGDMLIAKG